MTYVLPECIFNSPSSWENFLFLLLFICSLISFCLRRYFYFYSFTFKMWFIAQSGYSLGKGDYSMWSFLNFIYFLIEGSLLYWFFFLLQWILSYIEMNQPWVYTCSPSQSPLPPPSPPDLSRSSQCTRSKRLSHASNLGWWSVSP